MDMLDYSLVSQAVAPYGGLVTPVPERPGDNIRDIAIDVPTDQGVDGVMRAIHDSGLSYVELGRRGDTWPALFQTGIEMNETDGGFTLRYKDLSAPV
jgi:hypothetical protein